MTDVTAGRPAEGLAALRALEPKFTGLLRPKLGVLFNWQAEALLALRRWPEALEQATAAAAELARAHDLDSLWRSHGRRGRALRALGRPREALAAFLEGVDVIGRLRRAPLGHRLDSLYLADKLPLFEQALDMAAQLGDGEAACRLIESIKARALTAVLTVPAGAPAPDAHRLESQVEDLSRRLLGLELRAYNEGASLALEAERAELLAERAAVIERLRILEPRWRSMTEPVPFETAPLLARLGARQQAALTIYVRAEAIVAVLLHGDEITVDRVPLARATREALEAYAQNLQRPDPDPALYDPAALPALDAGALCPPRLLDRALGAEGLIIVPHGSLHLLPWAALRHGEARLFERCPVAVFPNLSCLTLLGRPSAEPPRVALCGPPDYRRLSPLPPLRLGAAEVKTIESIYGEDRLLAPPLKDDEATRAAFLALAGQEDAEGAILHVVCHGDFVAGDPLRSGLLLADGKVDSVEIARLRLRYDEVVLGACSLGFRPTEVDGVHLGGDDIVGVAAAYLEAGARSLLASIPPARDDSTLAFMTLYHERRAAGDTPMTALQFTQKEMLASADYEPCLWVGFTIYGGE